MKALGAVFLSVPLATAVEWGFDKLTKCQGHQKDVRACDLSPCGKEECVDCVWGSMNIRYEVRLIGSVILL